MILDIETDGLLDDLTKIHVMSYSPDGNKVYHTHDYDEMRTLLLEADKLIGHNIIGYDIPAIKKVTGIDLSHIKTVDTLVLSRLFKPTREGGHGLESWGYRLKFNKGDYG